MDLQELKLIWSLYNEKLESNVKLNNLVLKKLILQNTKHKLNKALVALAIEALAFFIFLFFIVNFALAFHHSVSVFISCIVLGIFGITGLAGIISQIGLISEIKFDLPVVEIQKKIERVKMQGILFLKIALMSIPFYMCYVILGFRLIWGVDIFVQGDKAWWWSQIILSVGVFLPLCIWLWKKISYKNIHIKWVRALVERTTYKQLSYAMENLKETEAFEMEE
ncbi:MAG: hypothetical protein C5B52_11650 [Bacteroidetes bacterium]|nr:MAG: hypothetical protein C5B52_11650 [Bacteroidota bacterium]